MNRSTIEVNSDLAIENGSSEADTLYLFGNPRFKAV